MFNIAIPIIPIGFIADTFYIDRFCSDRFHTDTFRTDMFCLCTILAAYSLNKLKCFPRIWRILCKKPKQSYSSCTLQYFPSILRIRLKSFCGFSRDF